MTVARICQRHVELAKTSDSVRAAAQRMGNRNVGTLVVVDSDRMPLGIVTDRDLALKVLGEGVDPDTTSVGDVMTANPKTVCEESSVQSAMNHMRSVGVRRLPVVSLNGELTGLVSVDDFLALLSSEFDDMRQLLLRSSPGRLAAAGR